MFPLGVEADDGFVDGIIAAAVDLPLRPMVLREKVEETVAFFFGAGEVLIAIGCEEEFFGTGVFLRAITRSSEQRIGIRFRTNRRKGIGSVVLCDGSLVHVTIKDRAIEDRTIEDRPVMNGAIILVVLGCLHTFGLCFNNRG